LIHIIESTQNKFQTKLDSITKVLEELNSQNIVIQEIAENIGILSINASIEAARAGNSGRGFHVISEEVKKLSTQTNVILEKMNDAMADAKKQIAKTVEDYKDDNTRLSREITSQKGSFEFFYGVLSSYEKDFSKIFGSAAEMMEKIDGHIKQFNPMFQLHEISIQELANLNSIINEFFARQGKEISDSSSGYTDINKEELFAKQILEMEKRSISEFELAVIKKMISLYGLDGKVILGKTGSDIEFF
jgi:methyl-accepting chemotaxis protein